MPSDLAAFTDMTFETAIAAATPIEHMNFGLSALDDEIKGLPDFMALTEKGVILLVKSILESGGTTKEEPIPIVIERRLKGRLQKSSDNSMTLMMTDFTSPDIRKIDPNIPMFGLDNTTDRTRKLRLRLCHKKKSLPPGVVDPSTNNTSLTRNDLRDAPCRLLSGRDAL